MSLVSVGVDLVEGVEAPLVLPASLATLAGTEGEARAERDHPGDRKLTRTASDAELGHGQPLGFGVEAVSPPRQSLVSESPEQLGHPAPRSSHRGGDLAKRRRACLEHTEDRLVVRAQSGGGAHGVTSLEAGTSEGSSRAHPAGVG